MPFLSNDNGLSPNQAKQRRALLATVHIARKSLGMADDDYRAVLTRITGHASAKDCDDRNLRKIIGEFERLGFKGKDRARGRTPATSAIARKARALWIGLHALGAVDSGAEKALEAFGRRQLGVDRLQWADRRHAAGLIEALKSMAAREGWDQTVPPRITSAERGRILTVRLAKLLIERTSGSGTTMLLIEPAQYDDRALHYLVNELGARLRTAKAHD